MAHRSRKRKRPSTSTARPAAGAAAPATPTRSGGRDAMRRGYAKAEVKNQAARDALEPMAPGERPRVVVVAAIWCLLIGGVMVVSIVTADGSSATGTRVGNALMLLLILVAVGGMLRLRYWAILGVQTILALSIVMGVIAISALTKAWLLPVAIAQPAISGVLFYRMVKVMARVQKTDILRREAQARETVQ